MKVDLMGELMARIQRVVDDCAGKDIETTMALVRSRSVKVITSVLRELDLWDEVKLGNPGEWIVVQQDEKDKTIIKVHISDKMRALLGKKG